MSTVLSSAKLGEEKETGYLVFLTFISFNWWDTNSVIVGITWWGNDVCHCGYLNLLSGLYAFFKYLFVHWLFRSMPTSAALDVVAKALNLKFFEVTITYLQFPRVIAWAFLLPSLCYGFSFPQKHGSSML